MHCLYGGYNLHGFSDALGLVMYIFIRSFAAVNPAASYHYFSVKILFSFTFYYTFTPFLIIFESHCKLSFLQ